MGRTSTTLETGAAITAAGRCGVPTTGVPAAGGTGTGAMEDVAAMLAATTAQEAVTRPSPAGAAEAAATVAVATGSTPTGGTPTGSTATGSTATDGTGPGASAPLGSDRGTRARIARLILENGPVTAADLSTRTGLTPAAVRRHLDNLLAGGMIEVRTARRPANRGRGRPAKLFVITDAGRSAFEHAYDDLAASALRFLAEVAGPAAVAEFARRQVDELERRYRPVMAMAEPSGKVAALAEALSGDGYAASTTCAPAGGRAPARAPETGEQLCQHHCPVAHVAAEFPQLCEAETEAFARLLGTPVQRLATIAHGDGICTTHVTAPSLVQVRSTHTPTISSGGISA